MRLTLTVLLLFAMLLIVSAAKAHVTRIPARCTTRIAPRLCATRFHAHRTNTIRLAARAPRIVYAWYAEQHPASRDRVLRLWIHRQARAEQLLTRYQRSQRATGGLPSTWLRDALCVHHYEGAWNANTGNGFTGGMQFLNSTWLSNGGGRYAPSAYLATPAQQLQIAYRTWDAGVDGPGGSWAPWPNTARMCGLL